MPVTKTRILNLCIIIALLIGVFFLGRQSDVSRYLLDLTVPVQTLTANVIELDDATTFTIQHGNLQIKVNATDETVFSDAVPDLAWPYLLKPRPPIRPSQKTIANISPGSRVTVNFKEDLRTLKKLELTAEQVQLYPFANSFKGLIRSANGNQIIVEGVPEILPGPDVTPEQEKKQVYTVNVNTETEISRIDPASFDPRNPQNKPAVLTYTIEDLKNTPDLFVNVVTREDVEKNTTVTALRIEPLSL